MPRTFSKYDFVCENGRDTDSVLRVYVNSRSIKQSINFARIRTASQQDVSAENEKYVDRCSEKDRLHSI